MPQIQINPMQMDRTQFGWSMKFFRKVQRRDAVHWDHRLLGSGLLYHGHSIRRWGLSLVAVFYDDRTARKSLRLGVTLIPRRFHGSRWKRRIAFHGGSQSQHDIDHGNTPVGSWNTTPRRRRHRNLKWIAGNSFFFCRQPVRNPFRWPTIVFQVHTTAQ